MHALGRFALSWIVKAIVVMVSVAAVSPKNRDNTLVRALGVSLAVALFVHSLGLLGIVLIIPALIAAVTWTIIYALAYGIGPLQSFGAGLVQAALAFVIDLFLFHGAP